MQQNTSVTVDWLKMNVPTLALLASAVWWLGSGTSETRTRIDAIEQSRQQRSIEAAKQVEILQKDIKNVSDSVTPLTTAIYRIGAIEGQLSEANRKSDKLSDAVVNLTTAVGVLNNKIDYLAPADVTRQK